MVKYRSPQDLVVIQFVMDVPDAIEFTDFGHLHNTVQQVKSPQ